MKKLAIFTVILSLFIYMLPTQNVSSITFSPSFNINSDSALLYSLDTKSILYEKNYTKQYFPAQLSQIMTAVICLENITDLAQRVSCPEEAFSEFPAYREAYPDNDIPTSGFQVSEELSYNDLLHAMMLGSSSEAANTIAFHIGGGSIQNFVNLMNEKAKELGATDTNFVNPSGLFAEGQLSTANDLLKITAYAFSLPAFEKISTIEYYEVPPSNLRAQITKINHSNVMMSKQSDYFDPYIKGLKTGNSVQSGRCLITKSSKNGVNYLLITLNSPISYPDGSNWFSHLEDAKRLFTWAFDQIVYTTILNNSSETTKLFVENAKDTDYVLLKPKDEFKSLWLKAESLSSVDFSDYNLYQNVEAPIYKGQKLGTLNLKYSGQTIFTTDLIATSDIELSVPKYAFYITLNYLKSGYVKKALIAGVFFNLIYIAIFVYITRKRELKKKISSKYNKPYNNNQT